MSATRDSIMGDTELGIGWSWERGRRLEKKMIPKLKFRGVNIKGCQFGGMKYSFLIMHMVLNKTREGGSKSRAS